jgi:hypothetical protein
MAKKEEKKAEEVKKPETTRERAIRFGIIKPRVKKEEK